MAGATARVFGVLLLILGVLLLIVGGAAFGFGSMDKEQYEEDRNALNRDEEREVAHAALIGGGLAALGVGSLLTILAVVLLVARRSDTIVTIEEPAAAPRSATGNAEPGAGNNRKMVVGAASAGSILVLLVVGMLMAGVAGSGPASGLLGTRDDEGPTDIQRGSGSIQAFAVGTTAIGTVYSEAFTPEDPDWSLLVTAQWDGPVEALQLIIEIDGDEVYRGGITSGASVPRSAAGQEITVTLQPLPDQFVNDVRVDVVLEFFA